MKARTMILAGLLLLCSLSYPGAASKGSGKQLEAEIVNILARKIPRFSQSQREQFAADLRQHLESHPAEFDSQLTSRFVEEYAKASPFVIVAASRQRNQEEYALELAVTKKKVDLFLEKLRLSDGDRALIAKQIERLSEFAEASLRKWLAGLDAPEFRALYADLKMTRDAAAEDPVSELIGLQRRAMEKAAASYFHYGFRRPLTDDEVNLVEAKWALFVEKDIQASDLRQKIAQQRQRAARAARLSDFTQRTEQARLILKEIQSLTFPARVSVAAVVKEVMKMPPTEEEKRASEAYAKKAMQDSGRY